MKKLLAPLILVFSVGFTSASIAETKAQEAPNPFSDDIVFKGDTIPFHDYEAWLDDVIKNAKGKRGGSRRIDGFTRTVNPLQFNEFKAKIDAQWIEYVSDGLKIAGVMLYPKDILADKSKDAKLPVIIYNRGGNAGSPWNRISITNRLMPLAAEGYIVLASQYRGSRYSEGKDEFGGADVNDVLRLVEIAKTMKYADANRIAMMGGSRGGRMTYQALRKNHEDIKAAIVIAGVSDAELSIKNRPEMEINVYKRFVPSYEENKAEALRYRSPIKWADEMSPNTPILMLHGTSDWRVSIEHSRKMAAELERLGRDYQFNEYPLGNHGLSFHEEQAHKAILEWLHQKLN